MFLYPVYEYSFLFFSILTWNICLLSPERQQLSTLEKIQRSEMKWSLSSLHHLQSRTSITSHTRLLRFCWEIKTVPKIVVSHWLFHLTSDIIWRSRHSRTSARPTLSHWWSKQRCCYIRLTLHTRAAVPVKARSSGITLSLSLFVWFRKWWSFSLAQPVVVT